MTGLNPYHLEPPARPLIPPTTWACPVCGQPRTWGLRNPVGRAKDSAPHAGCDRSMTRWTEALTAADRDPAYLAACDTHAAALARAAEAENAALTAWEAAARTLDVPTWFVDRQVTLRRLTDTC